MIYFDIKLLIIIGFFNATLQKPINKLNLQEGDICRKGNGTDPDHVCRRAENCESFAINNKNHVYPDVCSSDGCRTIVCCPSKTIKKQLICDRVKTNKKSILEAVCKSKERHFFPIQSSVTFKRSEMKHMALIGFGEQIEQVQWGCGGSLISQRWILTAAHCKQISYFGLARWARLGEINMKAKGLYDYKIVQHVIHPDYKPPSLYNDIALFRSGKIIYDVFSLIFPICVNSNLSFTPPILTAAGWGRNSIAAARSNELLKTNLDVFPTERCNNSYSSETNRRLKFGILDDKMICAGSVDGIRDTCFGDSGGPLQIQDEFRNNYFNYTYYNSILIGITSFGKFCGDPDAPGVYTRVSYYYSWIDNIVLD